MIFDVNIGYGVWPFRTTVRSVPPLVKKLTAAGIESGWVHSMENVWNYDIDRCNQILCRAWKNYRNFQVIPTLHEDYQQSLDLLRNPDIPGGIIYPNYHNYQLDSLIKIPAILQKLNKVLLLPLRLEDERNQHPLARIRAISVDQTAEFCKQYPDLKVLILNAKLNEAEALYEALQGNIFFDTSFFDGLDPLGTAASKNMLSKLISGSGAPLLEPLAAAMKERDYSGEYDPLQNLKNFIERQ